MTSNREARKRSIVATVLFTDMVGSTERAAALGDEGWRELLDRHNEIIRAELTRGGGREIDTAGGGFLAAFQSPNPAIRSPGAIREGPSAPGRPGPVGLPPGGRERTG